MAIDTLKSHALSLGFDAVGFCAPELPERVRAGLAGFLSLRYHGEMGWMEDRAELRGDPALLWPEARSVIVVGHNYAPPENPLSRLEAVHSGNISVYALNQDYHEVMKKRLKAYARWLVETHGGEVKVFVDTAPVMEKPLAEMAGIGWQGKHSCLVSREFGSWLFLGAVFSSLPLKGADGDGCEMIDDRKSSLSSSIHHPPSDPKGHCGSCTVCIDICPTQAIVAEGRLDARKCISYLTIEHKGHIPVEYRRAIGNRIYGCDDCLAVCPWNKFAQASQESAYHAREELKAPPLAELVTLDDAAFRALFAKSPVKRIGRDRFIRNVLIAIGNTNDPAYLPKITPLLDDASELVREACRWAVKNM